jgi:hypothetical protein
MDLSPFDKMTIENKCKSSELNKYNEDEITFPPTYKHIPGTDEYFDDAKRFKAGLIEYCKIINIGLRSRIQILLK